MASRRTTKTSQVESAAMIALSAGQDPSKAKLDKESLAAAEDAIKFKILERAEQRVKSKRAAAAGISDKDRALTEMSNILMLEAHDRDPTAVSAVAETEGVDTILGSLKLHEFDTVLQSNGLMALARLCHLPAFSNMSDEELEAAVEILGVCSKLQKVLLKSGALKIMFDAHALHKSDPVFGRAFCDAVAALTVNNESMEEQEISDLALMLCEAMLMTFHQIEYTRNHKPVPIDEQHGKDELVNSQGSEALAKMCLVKNSAKLAGQDSRIPFLVPCYELQVAVSSSGGIACLCECLRQFPKKKDTVLHKAVEALAIIIKLNEKCQREMVKHKGVDYIMASMQRWEEDMDYYMSALRTLRVLLEGSDGFRNEWYLDTSRGREIAKFVIKVYAAEGHRRTDREMQVAAQDMAKQWQSDQKRAMGNAQAVADQIVFRRPADMFGKKHRGSVVGRKLSVQFQEAELTTQTPLGA